MLKDYLLSTKVTDDMVLFWGSCFSNWHKAIFMVDGTLYTSAEQFMMRHKALYFEDYEALKQIMATHDPKEQKALGRKVRGFNQKLWEPYIFGVMVDGLVAKFSQTSELKETLLDTGNRTLVEASPYDKIWGIGLGVDDPKSLNRSEWLGANLLGECLMMARAIIQTRQAEEQALALVSSFMSKHHISSPETIHQVDTVVEEHADLIESLCEVAGWDGHYS